MDKRKPTFPDSDAWAANMTPLTGSFAVAAAKRGPRSPETAAEAEYDRFARMDFSNSF